MRILQPTAWTAAIDYLRVSHGAGEEGQKAELEWYAVQRQVATQLDSNSCAAQWRWMGYEGVTWNGVSVGRGRHGSLLQASGVAAAQVFDAGISWRGCSRLDLQVTYWYESDAPWVAEGVADLATEARHKTGTRPYKVKFIDGRGDGDTTYLGSRGKDTKYLRVYDKWREARGEGVWRYAWRWEVELTDGHAKYALSTLEDWGQSEHSVASLVAGYFAEKGVTIPDTSTTVLLPIGKAPRPATDTERRLRWLSEQVRPAIDKICASGVSSEEVRRLLGLTR